MDHMKKPVRVVHGELSAASLGWISTAETRALPQRVKARTDSQDGPLLCLYASTLTHTKGIYFVVVEFKILLPQPPSVGLIDMHHQACLEFGCIFQCLNVRKILNVGLGYSIALI